MPKVKKVRKPRKLKPKVEPKDWAEEIPKIIEPLTLKVLAANQAAKNNQPFEYSNKYKGPSNSFNSYWGLNFNNDFWKQVKLYKEKNPNAAIFK